MKMWSFRHKNNRRKRKIIIAVTYMLLILCQISLKTLIYMCSHTHFNITATPRDKPHTYCWNCIDREAKVKYLIQDHTASGTQTSYQSVLLAPRCKATMQGGPSAGGVGRGQISFSKKAGVNSVRLHNRAERIERKEIRDFERNRKQINCRRP